MEGPKLLAEAVRAGARIHAVYVDPSGASAPMTGLLEQAADAGAERFDLAPGVLSRVSDAVTPQPVAAIVAMVDVSLPALAAPAPDLAVVCVDVQDPGNAGTILRSAVAAGAQAVVFCAGAVDVYNPKAVRASAGAVFQVPLVTGPEPVEVLAQFGRDGLRRLTTVARGGVDYADCDLTEPTALVLGNEAHGLPPGVEEHVDASVSIPMVGPTESLNVAMAATVICFEAARQRRRHLGRTAPGELR